MRQPSWPMYPSIIDQIARTNFVLQNGVPQIDLAIYRYSFSTGLGSLWSDQGLYDAGYTWNYISPANLELPTGTLTDGVLAAQGPSYKAILVDNESSMPPAAARHISSYANAGFPVIFIGTTPSSTPGNNITGDAYVNATIASILSNTNVKTVPSQSDVVSALEELNVLPFVNTTFLTVHRWNATELTHYVYFYNQGAASTQIVTLQTGEGVPFLLDSLTGRIERIAAYTQTSLTTSVEVSLTQNEIALIAIGPPDNFNGIGSRLQTHAIPNPSLQANVTYGANSLVVKSFTGGEMTINLSNSSTVNVAISNPPERQTLNIWNITIHGWEPTANIYDATNHTETIYQYDNFSGAAIGNWASIDPQLRNVSGIGYYRTTFEWDGSATDGAILATGPIFHTQAATLNGRALDPFELFDPWIDITENLEIGTNELEIQIATTLQNRLLGLNYNIETSAAYANPPYPSRSGDYQTYGLGGPVVILPYAKAEIQVF